LLDCIHIWYRVLVCHRRYTANVQGQRSDVKVRRHKSMSQHKLMYQQQKRYKRPMGLAWRRAASSYNEFAIDTFSSCLCVTTFTTVGYVVNVVRAAVLTLKQDKEKMYYSFHRNFSWAHLLPQCNGNFKLIRHVNTSFT